MIRIERTSTVTQRVWCPDTRRMRQHQVPAFTRYRMDGTRFKHGASTRRRRGGLWGALSSMFRSAS